MQVSDLFIRRPVFAVVVSLLLIVGGLAALMNLPVREYPQVDRPVVSVSTVYRGASNEVIESRVTEIGTLELWCVARNGTDRWKLELNIRERERLP